VLALSHVSSRVPLKTFFFLTILLAAFIDEGRIVAAALVARLAWEKVPEKFMRGTDSLPKKTGAIG